MFQASACLREYDREARMRETMKEDDPGAKSFVKVIGFTERLIDWLIDRFFISLAFGRNELREVCQWRMFLGCLSHETPCSRICTSHHSSYCMREVNQLNLWPFGPKATNNMFPPFYCAITGDNRDKVMLLLQPFSCLFMATTTKKKKGCEFNKRPTDTM